MTRAGLRVATVEGGDGFSSLGFLKDLPIAELKMGRSFLAGIGSDTRSRVLIASTVATAHALDMTVVIEGVDTDDQRSAAISANVDGLQGHLVGASMPAATVLDPLLGQDQHIPPLRGSLGAAPRRSLDAASASRPTPSYCRRGESSPCLPRIRDVSTTACCY